MNCRELLIFLLNAGYCLMLVMILLKKSYYHFLTNFSLFRFRCERKKDSEVFCPTGQKNMFKLHVTSFPTWPNIVTFLLYGLGQMILTFDVRFFSYVQENKVPTRLYYQLKLMANNTLSFTQRKAYWVDFIRKSLFQDSVSSDHSSFSVPGDIWLSVISC